jgi:hypothetical protein
MNFSKHCDLCENQITNFEKGLTCKLTNKRPEFRNTCSKIKLNEKFQEKIEILNIELEKVRREKGRIHSIFYLIFSIGFILIIGGIFFFMNNSKGLYVLDTSLAIISIGTIFLGEALDKLYKFKKKENNAEFEKYELDEFLEKYEIEYETKINFQEKTHGIQEIIIKVEYKNWNKKRTTTPYKFYC